MIRTEQLEDDRQHQAGNVFRNYVTEGDGIRKATAQRLSVYDVVLANAYKQAEKIKNQHRIYGGM